MGNEPLKGDFLFDLIKQTIAAEHHALQDRQRHLLDRRVQNLCIHKTGDLKKWIDKKINIGDIRILLR